MPDRKIDVEALREEVLGLRAEAVRYAALANRDATADSTALEEAALRYVRRIDEELRKLDEHDYLAIYEQSIHDRDRGDN